MSKFTFLDSQEAVIFWNGLYPHIKDHPPGVLVAHWEEQFKQPDGVMGIKPHNMGSWHGHGCAGWQDVTEQKRMERMIYFFMEFVICNGCDPKQVILEFCKIKQFYELGARRDCQLRHVISTVTHGEGRYDWPPGSGEDSIAWL